MRFVLGSSLQGSDRLSVHAGEPNPTAHAQMQSAIHLITIDSSYRNRLMRLAWAKDRWIGACRGREVIVIKGGAARGAETWVAVFVENDKGLLSVRGESEAEALERAFALLEPAKRR